MIICNECFTDSEIRSIIEHTGRIGDCPVCGHKNVFIYDTDTDSELNGKFDNLLEVYTSEEFLPSGFPSDDKRLLVDVLFDEWDIFSSISYDKALEIVKSLSYDAVNDFPQLFTDYVGIVEKYDKDYLKKHSILRTDKWRDFVDSIKNSNRFHTNLINLELLADYCYIISKKLPLDKKRYYRGRISDNKKGFSQKDMGAPPPGVASDGRANAKGISRLYLTNDRETTLHEIRAAEYDYVTIGTFKPVAELNIVDLSNISNISPFMDVDCTALAINKEALSMINKEMSRTMRRGDSPLDYLPTQYICDFIMSITDSNGNALYDGIQYKSVMNSNGYNLAIFEPSMFKCTYCKTYEITELKYKMKPSN